MTTIPVPDHWGYKQHARRLMQIAVPVMLSYAGHIAVGTADSMMVGQLGKVPLAAVALANSLVVLPLTFGLGLSYGLTPLVAQADGRGKSGRIGLLLQHSLLINALLGVLLVLAVALVIPFLDDMNQPPEVAVLTGPYLFLLALSLFPLMLFQAYKQFTEGLGHTQAAMWATLGANGLNILLNWIFIFGKLGMPALGLIGAGYATLLSRVLMWLGLYLYVKYVDRYAHYRQSINLKIWKKKILRRLLQLGFPMGLQFSFEVAVFSAAVILAGWIGSTAQAAHQIAINLAALTYMLASGLSSAATVQVGNLSGRGDGHGVRMAGRTALGLVIGLEVIFALTFILGRNFFPTLYIDNLEVEALASGLLIIAAFFQLSDGIQVVAMGCLRGMEDVRLPTWITLVAYWLLALPVSYLLGFTLEMGVQGIWWGLLTGLTVAAILLSSRFLWLARGLGRPESQPA